MVSDGTGCEYGRCGGTGRYETKLQWPARIELYAGRKRWLVCEGCADLLTRQAREEGLKVTRRPIEPRVKPQSTAAPAAPIRRTEAGPGTPKDRRAKSKMSLQEAREPERARDQARVKEILAMRAFGAGRRRRGPRR